MELANYYYSFERVNTKKFGRFEYRRVNWEKENAEENLVVGDELMISKESILNDPQLELIKEIQRPDQSIAFQNYQGESRLTLWGKAHIVLSHKRLKYDLTTQPLKKNPKKITKSKIPFEIHRKTFFLEKKCRTEGKRKTTKKKR